MAFGPQNTIITLPVHLLPAWWSVQPPPTQETPPSPCQTLASAFSATPQSAVSSTYHLGGAPAPALERYQWHPRIVVTDRCTAPSHAYLLPSTDNGTAYDPLSPPAPRNYFTYIIPQIIQFHIVNHNQTNITNNHNINTYSKILIYFSFNPRLK